VPRRTLMAEREQAAMPAPKKPKPIKTKETPPDESKERNLVSHQISARRRGTYTRGRG
jgi:hypothetical protein